MGHPPNVAQIGKDPVTGNPVYAIASMSGEVTYASRLLLVSIQPDGTGQLIPVSSASYSGNASVVGLGSIIWSFDDGASQIPGTLMDQSAPDGQGGMLVTWIQRSSVSGTPDKPMLSRIVNGGLASSVAQQQSHRFIASNLDGTAFLSGAVGGNAGSITAIDVETLSPKWSVNANEFVAATDGGGIVIADQNGIENIDANGTSTPSGMGLSSPSLMYLDPGSYAYDGPFGQVNDVKAQNQSQQPKISQGFAVVQIGHTANRIASFSARDFEPVADCTGFDGDDPYGLPHGALSIQQDSFNTLVLRSAGIATQLVAKDQTLISSISPNVFNSTDANIQITVTAAPGKTGATWVNFLSANGTFIGKAFFVVVYPKLSKSVAYFKVTLTPSGLAPDNNWMPTQAAFQAKLNSIYETQANVHFTVTGPIPLNSSYDIGIKDGALDYQNPVEANQIYADGSSYTGFDAKLFAVRTIVSGSSHAIGGFAPGPEQTTNHPAAFAAQFASFGQCSICPQDVRQDSFPTHTFAHELGHHFGLYPIFVNRQRKTDHYPDKTDFQHLMSPAGDYYSLRFGSGACAMNFYEWEQLHGNPSDPTK